MTVKKYYDCAFYGVNSRSKSSGYKIFLKYALLKNFKENCCITKRPVSINSCISCQSFSFNFEILWYNGLLLRQLTAGFANGLVRIIINFEISLVNMAD